MLTKTLKATLGEKELALNALEFILAWHWEHKAAPDTLTNLEALCYVVNIL